MQFLTHIIFLLNLLKTLINHFSYASHIGCGIFRRKGRFSGAVSLVEVQKSNRVERLSHAEIRQLVGTGYCPHLYYGKFRPDGRLAHS